MKNIIKYICFSISIGLLLTSCEDSEEFTGASRINHSDVSVTLTSSQSTYTFNEADIDPDDPTTYSVNVTGSIAEPQSIDVIVSFKQTGGNADNHDYSVGEIRIPAGSTSGSTNIEVNKTGDIEGTETFTLQAVADGNSRLSSAYSVTTTINDWINDVLEFSTNWSGSYSYTSTGGANVTLDFCKIDIDVYVFTSTGSYVGDLGATASCTETGSISGLPDGDYFLVLDVYDNPLSVFGATETVPVTISYSQEYFDSGSFTVNSINLGSPEGLTAVATISVSGYNYTITPL